jgi:hypothetical protein
LRRKFPTKKKTPEERNCSLPGRAGRAYIGRGFGGSGWGFSKGVTEFNPAPVFNFLLRADDFAFFAFIRASPLFAFRSSGKRAIDAIHVRKDLMNTPEEAPLALPGWLRCN